MLFQCPRITNASLETNALSGDQSQAGSYYEERNMMTKLEAIVQPSRFEAVKEVLTELGIGGMTISDVRGHGRQKGHTEVYRGREYTVDLLPKIKIEIVIPDTIWWMPRFPRFCRVPRRERSAMERFFFRRLIK